MTIGRAYQDKQTGQWRESQSFGAADLLKLQPLLGEAYQTIRQEQARDREHGRTQPQAVHAPAPDAVPQTAPQQGLEAQQQAVMANATPAQSQPAPAQDQTIQPHHTRTPEQ